MVTQSIKNKISELFNSTPKDVGVGFGKKIKNDQYTGDLSIIFFVDKKKSKDELKENEILPSSVEIDGITYQTDVIETEGANTLVCDPPVSTDCYSYTSDDFTYRPIRGGISITSFNNRSSLGTLGLIAVDSESQSLVGLTNNHVVIKNAFYTHYQNLYGSYDNEINDRVYQSAFRVGDPVYEIGRVLRYEPIRPLGNGQNTIDAAIFSVSSSVIDINQSYKQRGITGFTTPLPFATTSEIDNLLSTDPPLLSVGRTTGPKEGYPCGLDTFSLGVTLYIAFNMQGYSVTTEFTDVIGFRRINPDCLYPVAPGDSGSALIANFGGTYKIIGLVFALSGNAKTGYACRIDNIASNLGIEAWTGGTKNFIDPNSIELITTPGKSLDKTITCSGKTFYQVGFTTINNPC